MAKIRTIGLEWHYCEGDGSFVSDSNGLGFRHECGNLLATEGPRNFKVTYGASPLVEAFDVQCATGGSGTANKGCRPARISCANPDVLPRTTTSFMSAIVSTPVGKRIFTNDSLLRMRMDLYPPILGSPHFWQTDKARFLKEQSRCWNS